ncbi:MAG: hypothetical protein RSC69_08225 [Lachnospiraceae bacterium]
MKRIASIILVLAVTGVLTGCGGTFSTEESAVSIQKNGKIIGASIETFDKKYYKEADLDEYVKEEVSTYTSKAGKDSIKITSFKVEEKYAKLFLKYETGEDYAKFNGEEFFSGTLPEAMAEGYDFAEAYFYVEGTKLGKSASRDEFLDNPDLKVVILKEKLDVLVPGKICFVSNNVKLTGKESVSPLKDKKGNYLDDGTQDEFITVIYE